LHNPATFDPKIYNGLTIEKKLNSCRRAISSIRKTLSPGSSDIEKINITYIDTLKEELSEYLKMFEAVMDAFPDHPMDPDDIKFIEMNCKDASSVYTAIVNALTSLRAARDALKTIEDNKRNAQRFDIHAKAEFYQCLHTTCCGYLTMVLENMPICQAAEQEPAKPTPFPNQNVKHKEQAHQPIMPTNQTNSTQTSYETRFNHLKHLLTNNIDNLELQEICRVVGINYQSLDDRSHATRAFSLMSKMENEARLDDLEQELRKRLPKRFPDHY
jgi:hypothetical protein